eukprot:NODE_29_length_37665_cov_1.081563.p32 type:complete len:113 gc:universal NODE_29_length_37665_cov_1.081563:31048-31386(+)
MKLEDLDPSFESMSFSGITQYFGITKHPTRKIRKVNRDMMKKAHFQPIANVIAPPRICPLTFPRLAARLYAVSAISLEILVLEDPKLVTISVKLAGTVMAAPNPFNDLNIIS